MKTCSLPIGALLKCMIASLSFFIFSSAAAKSIITGRFISTVSVTDARYFLPIDGFYNEFLDPHTINTGKDGSFSFALLTEKPGFVHIRVFNDDIPFLVTPGDTVHIDIYCAVARNENTNISRVVFGGNNAKGWQAYFNNRVSQKVMVQRVFSVPFNTIEDLVAASRLFIDSAASCFDSLYSRQCITDPFRQYIKGDIRGELAWRMLKLFEHFGNEYQNDGADAFAITPAFASTLVNRKLFTADNNLLYRQAAFTWQNVSDPSLLSSYIGIMLVTDYYKELYEHGGQRMVFDSRFAQIKPAQRYLGVMQGRTLEVNWANELSWQIVLEKDKQYFLQWYTLFTRYFPDSAFIPYLQKRVREKMQIAVSAGKKNMNP